MAHAAQTAKRGEHALFASARKGARHYRLHYELVYDRRGEGFAIRTAQFEQVAIPLRIPFCQQFQVGIYNQAVAGNVASSARFGVTACDFPAVQRYAVETTGACVRDG